MPRIGVPGTTGPAGASGLPSSVVSKTTTYTAVVGELVQCDATSAGFTVTLPSSPAVGATVGIKKIDTTTNVVTVVAASSGTIDGDANATVISQYAGGTLEHVGSNNWIVVTASAATNVARRGVRVFSVTRTAGDLSFNTTGWQDVSTSLDITLTNVQVGDVIEYNPSLWSASIANALAIDACTVVSGSPVNYFGTAGGATDNGVMGWYTQTSVANNISGSAFYTIQAGDISSGSVLVRLRVRPSTTTARVINASALSPARIWAKLIPGSLV